MIYSSGPQRPWSNPAIPALSIRAAFRKTIEPARKTHTVIRMVLTTAVMLGSIVSGALSHDVSAEDLPVPPVPPANLPLPDTAPVPNPNAKAPVADPSDAPSVDVKLYRARPYDPGVGFTPGSRYQSNEDRKPIQTPGLSFSVPIK